MRYTISLIFLTVVLLASCSKNEYPDNPNAMKFEINGIKDLDMQYKDSASLILAIARTGGNQEKLQLYVEGLPANATANFETNSGTPDFATSLTFKTNGLKGGNYNLKIIGTPASGTSKTYDMLLHVPDLGCAYEMFGYYTSVTTGAITATGGHNIVHTGVKDEVRIEGTPLGDYVAQLNCANHTITVKEFSSGTRMVKGSGTYTATSINLVMYEYDGAGSSQFTVTLTRH